MERMLKKAFNLLSFVLLGLAARTQSPPPEIANTLQNVVNNSLPLGFSHPGVVMGISVPGQWSWYGSAGDAIVDLTTGQPITAATLTTRFRVGSISKMMVATAILKMEEDALLSFYDPLLNGAIINNTQLTKMQTVFTPANNYGLGMEFSMLGSEVYHEHYGELANSSALYHSTKSSSLAPNGYFLAYNYNVQGVNMSVKMNVPVYQVMMSNVGIDELLNSSDIFCAEPCNGQANGLSRE